LPFGHVPDMVTLPVGAQADLHVTTHGFELALSGYPHLG
jgi:muramoyltetrapeptide carboxypeptidase